MNTNTYEEKVYDHLDKLNIKYKVINHKPLYTMEDTKSIHIKGVDPKNLFIKDKRQDKYYLVVMAGDAKLDTKALRQLTGASSKTTFASDEELQDILKLKPGSCTPFGLLNDLEQKVTLVVMGEIGSLGDKEIINFHPNINTATLELTMADFKKYLASLENPIIIENLVNND